MIIVTDVDNTINNLQETVIKVFNERHKRNYAMNYFQHYNIEDDLPKNDAILMREIYADPTIYDQVTPIHGSQNALRKLVNDGHEVYFASDVIPSTYEAKVAWLNHYFPFIDNAHICAIKHKWLLNGDVLIEDNLDNLLAKPYMHRVCIDHLWNRDVNDWARDIYRVQDWDNMLDVINKIKELE